VYHGSQGVFPAGLSDNNPVQYCWVTWAMSLLPYIEQENVGKLYDLTKGTYAGNATVFRIKIQTFLCPSDNADREGGPAKYDVGGPGFSRSNVMACFSADGTWIEPGAPGGSTGAENPSAASGKRALFNRNIARSVADVLDGTSNTVAVSEIISGPNDSHDLRGMWWQDVSCHYEHKYGPNSPRSDVMVNWYALYCDASKVWCETSANSWFTFCYAASSYHPGGVNVGLADGSAGFVSDRINHAVWQALGSVNGGGKNAEETSPGF
jgi:prepilin-type processing-associated H-X9-DG protein